MNVVHRFSFWGLESIHRTHREEQSLSQVVVIQGSCYRPRLVLSRRRRPSRLDQGSTRHGIPLRGTGTMLTYREAFKSGCGTNGSDRACLRVRLEGSRARGLASVCMFHEAALFSKRMQAKHHARVEHTRISEVDCMGSMSGHRSDHPPA